MCIKRGDKSDDSKVSRRNTSKGPSPQLLQAKQAQSDPSEFLPTEEDKTQKEVAEEKRLNDVYKAMGAKPNSAMAEKLLQDKKKEAPTNGNNLEKFGDIGFGLKEMKRPPSAEDTVYDTPKVAKERNPLKRIMNYKSGNKQKKGGAYAYNSNNARDNEMRDFTVDVEFEPADETNFMANLPDIEYVAHDMIRTMNRHKMKTQTAQTADKQNATSRKHVGGVGAPLNVIEKDSRFSWNEFKTTTFLSNALSLPTHEERDCVATARDDDLHIVWVMPVLDVKKFEPFDEITCKSIPMSGELEDAKAF